MRVPWTARRSNQSILKEINPEYSLEGLMLKLKFQSTVWPPDAKSQLVRMDRCWERLKAGGEGDNRGRAGWMASLNGHEFEQAPGDGGGQGSPACCSPWGHKESDTTERLNNNTLGTQRLLTSY